MGPVMKPRPSLWRRTWTEVRLPPRSGFLVCTADAASRIDQAPASLELPRRVQMTSFAAILAATFALVVPSVASADSGAITGVAAVGDGQVVATYTTTFARCTSSGYCGWFPQAAQVPSSVACPAKMDGSHITYVGQNQDTGGTQTGTDTFYPAY